MTTHIEHFEQQQSICYSLRLLHFAIYSLFQVDTQNNVISI